MLVLRCLGSSELRVWLLVLSAPPLVLLTQNFQFVRSRSIPGGIFS